jgi:hypothetical protein
MSTSIKVEQPEISIADKPPAALAGESCGRPVSILTIDGLPISISGKLLKVGRVRDEPYDCLADSEKFMAKLRQEKNKPDLFTFMQPVADQQPHHPFYHEPESLAVLRITSHKNWFKKQIRTHTRNHIRKAQNKGVDVRQVPFDDELVRGVKAIFDECPIRQGKPFWHYHKDLETIRAELATFPDRSDFLGAYFEGELIGYIKVTTGNGSAGLMQIISKISDRDKAPTNALMSKVVELCAEQKIAYLHYGLWSKGSFGLFKQNHAFECHDVPRYFVPLTAKGRLMLKLGLHRKITDYLPLHWYERMVKWRNSLNAFRYRQKTGDGAGT